MTMAAAQSSYNPSIYGYIPKPSAERPPCNPYIPNSQPHTHPASLPYPILSCTFTLQPFNTQHISCTITLETFHSQHIIQALAVRREVHRPAWVTRSLQQWWQLLRSARACCPWTSPPPLQQRQWRQQRVQHLWATGTPPGLLE